MALDDPRSAREVVQVLLAHAPPVAAPNNGIVESVAVLLSRIGYNLKDAANLSRANDQLVRARASELLSQSADALGQREARFREVHVPPSTREQPFPPADVMHAVRALDGLRKRVQELGSTVLTLETPANDRVWERLRSERTLLEDLLSADVGLVAGAHDVLDAAQALTSDAIRGTQLGELQRAVDAVERAVHLRRGLLAVMG